MDKVKEIRKNLMMPFIKLDFDENKHVYFVENKPLKASVSKLIKEFYIPFPASKKARELTQENKDAGVINKYTGMSEKEILAQWKAINKEAIDRGHRVHLFGEHYPSNPQMKPKCKQEEAVVKFWKDLPDHIIPVTMELRMYHFTKMFGGTADIILFDTKKGEYIIADYKTNNDLFKNFRSKKMTGIFSHLLDMPFSHYEIQLSYYQIMLEQTGCQVGKRVIVYLQKDGNYTLYDTTDYTKELKEKIESYA
jgi:hypothetical protein